MELYGKSNIPGLMRFKLKTHVDDRGSFTELMNIEKMRALGLPKEFNPTAGQINISKNVYGTIRGIHAEPWNKLITCINGEFFVAIVDLRYGTASYMEVQTFHIGFGQSVFVPKGCGNSFAATCFLDGRAMNDYLYVVDDTWRFGENYDAIRYNCLGIPWPIRKEVRVVDPRDISAPDIEEYTAKKAALWDNPPRI